MFYITVSVKILYNLTIKTSKNCFSYHICIYGSSRCFHFADLCGFSFGQIGFWKCLLQNTNKYTEIKSTNLVLELLKVSKINWVSIIFH